MRRTAIRTGYGRTCFGAGARDHESVSPPFGIPSRWPHGSFVLGPGEVAWQEWAWQTDDPEVVDTSELADLPTVRFDRAEYEQTLRDWRAPPDM